MRFIKVWSYKCADFLTQKLNENHEKRGIYYFGFQVVIGGIVKVVSLFIISLILGVLMPTFVTLAFFVSLRLLAGGYHMDTYGKCIALSLALFVLSGVIVQYTIDYWTAGYITALAVATFAVGLYVIIKWAPKDTPNKPITKPEEIRRFKTLSIIHICLWIVLELVLVYFKLNMYALAGCFGIIIAIFIVTPVGNRFFDMISGKIDKAKKVKASA